MPPWLAQQRNPAISPYTKGKEQAPVTLKTSVEKKQQSLGEGEKGGGGGWRENGCQNPSRKETERANKSRDLCSQLLGMRLPKTADLWHVRRS